MANSIDLMEAVMIVLGVLSTLSYKNELQGEAYDKL